MYPRPDRRWPDLSQYRRPAYIHNFVVVLRRDVHDVTRWPGGLAGPDWIEALCPSLNCLICRENSMLVEHVRGSELVNRRDVPPPNPHSHSCLGHSENLGNVPRGHMRPVRAVRRRIVVHVILAARLFPERQRCRPPARQEPSLGSGSSGRPRILLSARLRGLGWPGVSTRRWSRILALRPIHRPAHQHPQAGLGNGAHVRCHPLPVGTELGDEFARADA